MLFLFAIYFFLTAQTINADSLTFADASDVLDPPKDLNVNDNFLQQLAGKENYVHKHVVKSDIDELLNVAEQQNLIYGHGPLDILKQTVAVMLSLVRFTFSIVLGNRGLASLRLANTVTILLDSLHYQVMGLKDFMKSHLQNVPMMDFVGQVFIQIFEIILLVPKIILKLIRALAGVRSN